jgi:rhodanese-related sulfurtransferase
MPSPSEITIAQLSRLIGLPGSPAIIDVRDDDDYAADPRLIPGARHHDYREVAGWCQRYAGRPAVIVCQKGLKLSQGVAALLRHEGIEAESLEGGMHAWHAAKQTSLNPKHLPKPDVAGRTLWVTRARPKIDRIACPWLIRRFIDPQAVFLYVAPPEVPATAERFGAAPFDIENVFWSHRGEKCTFDTMVEEFGLSSPSMDRLALIVRGADTSRHDLAPESAGLLAASLGYSRMYKDDLAQLEASMALYDALYRWCRDAQGESHDWPAPKAAN